LLEAKTQHEEDVRELKEIFSNASRDSKSTIEEIKTSILDFHHGNLEDKFKNLQKENEEMTKSQKADTDASHKKLEKQMETKNREIIVTSNILQKFLKINILKVLDPTSLD
jgi:signal transduction histidine kinase